VVSGITAYHAAYWQRTAKQFVGRRVRMTYDSDTMGQGALECVLQTVSDTTMLIVTDEGILRKVRFESLVGLEGL